MQGKRYVYISSIRKKSRCGASFNPGYIYIYILSAKYRILRLNEQIEPYNETLNDCKKEERMRWGQEVYAKCKEMGIDLNNSVYLVGDNYMEGLYPFIDRSTIKEPLKHKLFGERLSILTNIINKHKK